MCLSSVQPPEPQKDVVLEDEVKKPPEPKGWTSLGSEREIEEESAKETRKRVLWFQDLHILHLSNHYTSLFCSVSAMLHVLQSAQDVWGTRVFFRPQRCR